MRQHGKHRLLILFGCILLACMGLNRVAVAGGGDVDWFDPLQANSVVYQGGKVYWVGLDFTNGIEVVISCRTAKDGRLLWEERLGEERIGPFWWFEPAQIAVSGRHVAVGGFINRGPPSFGDLAVIMFDSRKRDELKLTVIPDADPIIELANSVAIVGNHVVTAGTEITDFFGGFPFAFNVTRGFDLKTGELIWTDKDPRRGASFGDKVVAVSGDDDDDSDSDSDSDNDFYADDDDYEGPLALTYGLIAHVDDPDDPNDDGDFTDERIRAYDPRNGNIVWSSTIADNGRNNGGVDAFVVDDGVAYFAFSSDDPSLGRVWQARAVDAWTGAPMWTMDYGQGEVNGLAVKGSQLAAAVDCGIVKVEAHTGAALWASWPENACALNPIITQGRIVALGFSFEFQEVPPWLPPFFENVTAFRTQDGVQTWTTDVSDTFHPVFFEKFNLGDLIDAGRGQVYVGGYDQLTVFDVR